MKQEWTEKGCIDEPVAEGVDLKKEIRELCRQKNAVLLTHYYTVGEVQEVADFIGDSLALARTPAETDADMIVMCGVHFMAGETCKLRRRTRRCLPRPHGGMLARRPPPRRRPREVQGRASARLRW